MTSGIRNHLVVNRLRSLKFSTFPFRQRLSLRALLHWPFISKLPKLVQCLLLKGILMQRGVLTVSIVQNHSLSIPRMSSVDSIQRLHLVSARNISDIVLHSSLLGYFKRLTNFLSLSSLEAYLKDCLSSFQFPIKAEQLYPSHAIKSNYNSFSSILSNNKFL